MERDLIEEFKGRFKRDILKAWSPRGKRVFIEVDPEKLRIIARYAKDKLGFNTPVSLGVVDYLEKGFQLNYYLWSTEKRVLLIIRSTIPREIAEIESLTDLFEALNYHEREAWEMFGIKFRGHPKLERLLLPEDWKGGYPLRRDFKYEG